MQKSRASFTVFFEDPFWVGVYEREEPGGLTARRVVFGAEPKDGEIYECSVKPYRNSDKALLAMLVKRAAYNKAHVRLTGNREPHFLIFWEVKHEQRIL